MSCDRHVTFAPSGLPESVNESVPPVFDASSVVEKYGETMHGGVNRTHVMGERIMDYTMPEITAGRYAKSREMPLSIGPGPLERTADMVHRMKKRVYAKNNDFYRPDMETQFRQSLHPTDVSNSSYQMPSYYFLIFLGLLGFLVGGAGEYLA